MYARNSIYKENTTLPFYGEEAKAQLAQHHKWWHWHLNPRQSNSAAQAFIFFLKIIYF